ncbi:MULTISPECIES: hypothetical protein [unclassified Cryobacterium]|uniref:hypothetical protein n=1 Tax=unclassified Cryobacterium TaxID=2649013 RepID=UPI00106A66F7|nr:MULTISPECIES: hypothetical protein [unclassified Cryobacterium]MDY7526936.1 hypothetical protein [Cryobacterium sp. 10C2]MEB0004492.1 hypothetical protein [Cryobacterium sp. RTC2.1]MEB0201158.1 hypothetical protein [Cryobacterium sp. 5I3]MEB0288333.1 hypothetical protein [Cryobacterium sp. 10S3]MEB0292468.1 hypothetical protein [Cryobacterium sp. 10C2]
MFQLPIRSTLITGALVALLALVGTVSISSVAQADDSGVVALTVSVADKLPNGPVEIHCVLPVGSRVDSAPVFVTVHGLKPFSHVEVWVHSTPFLLISGNADAAGDFAGSGTLPPDLEAGGHTIEVIGTTAADDPFSQVAASFAVTDAGTIGSATTSDTNGVLSLVVPAAAVAAFNAPVLVSNRSTTTGVLGSFAVSDSRVLTQEGWILSADVADFVNAADGSVIGASQLGLAPQLVSTDATGVSLVTAQTAGSATYPMNLAVAAPAQTVGTTVLNAGLTFVAPPEKSVGTYRSTLSLTLVSQ